MTDAEWLELLEKSPKKAHTMLIEEYGGYVYAVVIDKLRSLCSSEEIEDCVSDVFVELFTNIHNFDSSKGSLKAYISVISKRMAINAYRKLSYRQNITVSVDDEENSVELNCDMNDSFTDESGQLYVKITEEGLNSQADVINKLREHMTENCLNSRYSVLVDTNSGKFIEKENGLYIKYAPKAFLFNNREIFMDYNYNKEENCYVLLGTYDNFGERCDIEYIFRYEGDVLKIDEIKY